MLGYINMHKKEILPICGCQVKRRCDKYIFFSLHLFLHLLRLHSSKKKGAFLITDKIILWNTDYGLIDCNLKNILDSRGLSIYMLSRLSGIKYDVLKRYYDNELMKYDGSVLARICYSLNCEISDLLQYKKK